MTLSRFYPLGTPGQPWGPAEVQQWRARQVRQRSYADDVLAAVEQLRNQWDVECYGEVVYADAALGDLFTDPAARGRGVGTQLMNTARAFALLSGAKGLTLETAVDNLSAQRLYESLGYVRDPGYYTYCLDLKQG